MGDDAEVPKQGKFVFVKTKGFVPKPRDSFYEGVSHTVWSYHCKDPNPSDDPREQTKSLERIRAATARYGKLFLWQQESKEGMRVYGANGTKPFYKHMIRMLKKYYAPCNPNPDSDVPSFYEVCSAYEGSLFVRFALDIDMRRADEEQMHRRLGTPEDLPQFERDMALIVPIVEIITGLLHEHLDPLVPGLNISHNLYTAADETKISFHVVFEFYDDKGFYYMESIKNIFGFFEEVVKPRFLCCQTCGTDYEALYCANESCGAYMDGSQVPPGVFMSLPTKLHPKSSPQFIGDELIYHKCGLMRTFGPKYAHRAKRARCLRTIHRDEDGNWIEPQIDSLPTYEEFTDSLLTYIGPGCMFKGTFCWVPAEVAGGGSSAIKKYRVAHHKISTEQVKRSVAQLRRVPGLEMMYNYVLGLDPLLTGQFKPVGRFGNKYHLESEIRYCQMAKKQHTNRGYWIVNLDPSDLYVQQFCYSAKLEVCASTTRPKMHIKDHELARQIREQIMSGESTLEIPEYPEPELEPEEAEEALPALPDVGPSSISLPIPQLLEPELGAEHEGGGDDGGGGDEIITEELEPIPSSATLGPQQPITMIDLDMLALLAVY
jgi:hypothetical protein